MDAGFQRHVIKIDMVSMTQTEADEFIRLWRKAQVTVDELVEPSARRARRSIPLNIH